MFFSRLSKNDMCDMWQIWDSQREREKKEEKDVIHDPDKVNSAKKGKREEIKKKRETWNLSSTNKHRRRARRISWGSNVGLKKEKRLLRWRRSPQSPLVNTSFTLFFLLPLVRSLSLPEEIKISKSKTAPLLSSSSLRPLKKQEQTLFKDHHRAKRVAQLCESHFGEQFSLRWVPKNNNKLRLKKKKKSRTKTSFRSVTSRKVTGIIFCCLNNLMRLDCLVS